jgi:hypothetical protein
MSLGFILSVTVLHIIGKVRGAGATPEAINMLAGAVRERQRP